MGVTLSQSVAAAFPDRPISVEGVGLLVSMSEGGGGQYLEHDVGLGQDVLHIRFLLNTATAAGGSVVLLVGVDFTDSEVFRIALDADMDRIAVSFITGDVLVADLVTGLPWHCIELMVDRVNGRGELWVNGVSYVVGSGLSGLLQTQKVWLGAVLKDDGVIGDLYLDEWVLSGAYIGPVVIEPDSLYADTPSRWLVVYNTAEADSVTWAEGYRQARGVPFANLVGLSLSGKETIDFTQWLDLLKGINDYLVQNDLEDQILGLLLGYRVPGYVDFNGLGLIEAIPALLHQDTASLSLNPLSVNGVPERPTGINLEGFRLTARIDGGVLADGQALVSRSMILSGVVVGDGLSSTIWLDPYINSGSGVDPHVAGMVDWSNSLDRMRTRLPLKLSVDLGSGQESGFDGIQDDGFFWGWALAVPPAGFFGTPVGDRVFCFQLDPSVATGATLRDSGLGGWVHTALSAGYAAAAGSSRPYSSSAVPFIRPFFEGLRRGWTLAESWFVANPVPGEGLFLVGDPLMTVGLPQGGWDVFGPLNRLEDLDPSTPSVAFREDERVAALPASLRPLPSTKVSYLIRHLDQLGRTEGGVRLIQTIDVLGQSTNPPLPPIWPDIVGWPVLIESGLAKPGILWDQPIDSGTIQLIELEGEIDGGPVQVLQSLVPDSFDRYFQVDQVLPNQTARYRWRIDGVGGASLLTPWSEQVRPLPMSSVALTILESC